MGIRFSIQGEAIRSHIHHAYLLLPGITPLQGNSPGSRAISSTCPASQQGSLPNLQNDENNECNIGDIVALRESKPISKTKTWQLVSILEKVIIV